MQTRSSVLIFWLLYAAASSHLCRFYPPPSIIPAIFATISAQTTSTTASEWVFKRSSCGKGPNWNLEQDPQQSSPPSTQFSVRHTHDRIYEKWMCVCVKFDSLRSVVKVVSCFAVLSSAVSAAGWTYASRFNRLSDFKGHKLLLSAN